MTTHVPTAPDPQRDPTCPICGGSGEVVHIDEEVGCHVVQPCWRCALSWEQPSSPSSTID